MTTFEEEETRESLEKVKMKLLLPLYLLLEFNTPNGKKETRFGL